MYISNLYLQNFKVFPEAHLQFQKRRVIITGSNGFGKTTLLEAFHTFLTSYSFSKQKDNELLTYQKTEYTLLGDIKSMAQHHSLFLRYDNVRRKKRFSLDGKDILRYKSLLEKFPVVFFTPLDIQSILGEPSFRRSFFDRMLSYLNPEYYMELRKYKKILQERNHLLKTKDYSLMDMWDEKFLETATFLVQERLRYLYHFNQLHQELSLDIPDFLQNIRFEYKGPKNRADLEKLLSKYQLQERRKQMTLWGPHRDDYLFIGANQRELKTYFSLGQIKWTAFYFKFLEVLLMNKILPSSPVFLIDDVFSELDKTNRQLVFPLLNTLPNQILSTVTDFDWVSDHLAESFETVFLEKPGKILERIS